DGAARSEGFRVCASPGPSGLLAALAARSFAAHPLLFWGFLPAKARQRRAVLQSLSQESISLVFYESPVRLLPCLRDLLQILGDRRIFLGRELTKLFVETVEGKTSEVLARFQDQKILGEITLIVEVAPAAPRPEDLDA